MGEKLDAQDLKVEETIAQVRGHCTGKRALHRQEGGMQRTQYGKAQRTKYGRVQAFILLLWQLQFRDGRALSLHS